MSEQRGVYVWKDRGCQALRFDGMLYKNITPTDIDGLMELRNKAWIVFEAKHRDAKSKYGQKLALERFCECVTKAGKHCLVMIVEHNVDKVTDDVFLNPLQVREVITSENMKWHPPNRPVVVGESVYLYINEHFGSELIGEEETERYNRLMKSIADGEPLRPITNELSIEQFYERLLNLSPSLYIVLQKSGTLTICSEYVRLIPNDTIFGRYVEQNYLRINRMIEDWFSREFVIESA